MNHSRKPFLAAGLALWMACTGAQAQWTQNSFNAAKTNANTSETTLTTGSAASLTRLWQTMPGQFYVSDVTQADSRMFVCSNLLGVSASAAATGQVLWSQFATSELCGTPTLGNGLIYLTSYTLAPNYRNVLTAVDAVSGLVQWATDGPAGSSLLGYSPSPSVVGDRVFLSSGRSGVFALSGSNGAVIWQSATDPGLLNNDVAVADGRVFVSTWGDGCCITSRQLIAFSADTGARLWSAPTDTNNSQFPAMVLGARVYAGSDSGSVFAFDSATGARQWERRLDGGYVSSPLVGQGKTVFAAAGNNTLYALNAATGGIRWSRSTPRGYAIASNMAWANGALYLTVQSPFGGEHKLAVLNASSGRLLSLVPVSLFGSYARVSVADGRVMVATNQGTLEVFGVPAGKSAE
jgi:eukaryotic-like serine/threonine-protein kinase